MKTNTRRDHLTIVQTLAIGQRMRDRIDILMRQGCAGGLQYGWDFATFSVIFPRKHRAWRMLRQHYLNLTETR